MRIKRSIMVMAEGSPNEFHKDIFPFNSKGRIESYEYSNMAMDAFRHWKIETPRSMPQTLKVKFFELTIKEGKIEKTLIHEETATPPLSKMTEAEYIAEMKSLAESSDLPKEFIDYANHEAWKCGHANGYEEVLVIAENIYNDLKPVFAAYQKRITEPK